MQQDAVLNGVDNAKLATRSQVIIFAGAKSLNVDLAQIGEPVA